MSEIREVTPAQVRRALLSRSELALVDVRPEALFAQGHPLFAASLPYDRLELEVLGRVPRLGTPMVTYDGGSGLARVVARRLGELGYSHVGVMQGGLGAWQAHGYELFQDVNVPSKAFGELVARERRTPMMEPGQLWELIQSGADVVVADVRRPDEYHTMSIPTARNLPGGELALRFASAAPSPATTVVVNCAGRTRSIIGAQTLINLGVPNPVAALHNGTIGWSLAGLPLDRAARELPAPPGPRSSPVEARALAGRCHVQRMTAAELRSSSSAGPRTYYRFDVRSSQEYEAGHPVGFRWAPGGQLVQETDAFAPVRGAVIVLADDDGVRANVAGSWLAQMGWDVGVVDDAFQAGSLETGAWAAPTPKLPEVPETTVEFLAGAAPGPRYKVVELGPQDEYVAGHLEGSAWALRQDLVEGPRLAGVEDLVLVSQDDRLARYALGSAGRALAGRTSVLVGGKLAWSRAGRELIKGPGESWSGGPDTYRRPYEGTTNPAGQMKSYIQWELRLVDQLQRDGSHFFWVLQESSDEHGTGALPPARSPSFPGRPGHH